MPVSYWNKFDVIKSSHTVLGCSTRKTNWWPLEVSTETESVGFADWFSCDSHCWTRIFKTIVWFLGEINENLNDITSRSCGLTFGEELESCCSKKMYKNGQSRIRNSNTPEMWEEVILLIRVTKNTKTSSRMQDDEIPDAKAVVDSMRCDKSQELKERHRETTVRFILFHWRTSVMKRIQSWSHNSKQFWFKRQSRCGVVEVSDRACSVGHTVSRRTSPIRSVLPLTQPHRRILGLEFERMQWGDRRPSAWTIPVEGWGDGNHNSHGLGDDCGYTVGTHGSVDRWSRKQATSCGGWVELCLLVSSRRCSVTGLRSARVGEASHPGPSSCLRLRRATSVVAGCAYPRRLRPLQRAGRGLQWLRSGWRWSWSTTSLSERWVLGCWEGSSRGYRDVLTPKVPPLAVAVWC